MNALAKSVLISFAALGLAACAGQQTQRISTDARRLQQPVIMDGLNLTAMNQVLQQGFTEIKNRTIEEPEMDKVFLSGLEGLSKIDPEMTVVVADGHLKIRREHDDGTPPVNLGDAGPIPANTPKANI